MGEDVDHVLIHRPRVDVAVQDQLVVRQGVRFSSA